MLPQGWSRRKPKISYQQHSNSAGPCRQLSSGQWAFSELPSIELADTGWMHESTLARLRRPRSPHGNHHNLETQKCSSPGRRLRRLPNYLLVLSPVRPAEPVPLRLAQPHLRPESAYRRRSTFSCGSLRTRCESYCGKKGTIFDSS